MGGWANPNEPPCPTCRVPMRYGHRPPPNIDLAADGLRRLHAEVHGSGGHVLEFVNLTHAEQDSWRGRASRALAQLFAEGD